jgi:putative transposase
VFLSLVYLALRFVLQVLLLSLRSEEFKELEIVVLRHELAVVRRQVARPSVQPADRAFLAAASRLLPRARWRSFFVTPDTLVRWHRDLVRRRWTYSRQRCGRPELAKEIRDLVLRLARENPRCGYQRIVGEMGGLGFRVSATSVRQILRREGLGPAGERGGLSWHDFLRTHAHTMISCDFFTVDTLWLGRLYVLFFIELGSRRVHFAGCTANPSGEWVAQQARNLCWSLQERRTQLRFLIHDRDSKFTRTFDEIFRTEGLEIIRTPFRAPKANAVAERFVRTVRAECLDWLLIAGSRQLDRTLRTFADHYNTHRPHRALGLTPPQKDRPPPHLVAIDSDKHLRRRDRLGGLIHEYSLAA